MCSTVPSRAFTDSILISNSNATSARDNSPTLFEERNTACTPQPSPIEHLPSDLFVKIVKIVLDPIPSHPSPGNIEHLCLVCKRWCQVIGSVPGFWNTLHSNSTMHRLSAALDRSSDLPLDIVHQKEWLRDGNGMTNYSQRSLENMAALLVPHSPRWRSLCVILWGFRHEFNHKPKLEDVRTYAMPNLERLEIGGLGMEVGRWDDFGGHQPHLRSLELREYSIPWDSGILLSGTLQHLCISKIQYGIPTPEALCTILSSSPHLITLEIDVRETYLNIPGDLTMKATPILLLKLSTFSCNLELSTLIHILPRLHIPVCTHFTLNVIKCANRSDGQINLVVKSLQDRFTYASVDSCSRITVRAEPDYFHIITNSGYMDIQGIRGYQMLVMFLEIYLGRDGSTPERTVTLEWKGFEWGAILDLIADERFSKTVTSVILHNSMPKEVRGTLELLMEDVKGYKRCSNLRYIEVECDRLMAADVVRFAAQQCVDGSEVEGAPPSVQLCLVGRLFDGREMQELARSNKNVIIKPTKVS